MNKPLLIGLGIVNTPLYGALASLIFGKQGLFSAIRYAFIPDLISALRGEFWKDSWAQLMLVVWMALCGGLVWSEYHLIATHFPAQFSFFESFQGK